MEKRRLRLKFEKYEFLEHNEKKILLKASKKCVLPNKISKKF
jgi:hypothetical protein